MKISPALLLSSSLLITGAALSHGQTVSSGLWSEGSTWSSGSVPTAGFTVSDGHEVTMNGIVHSTSSGASVYGSLIVNSGTSATIGRLNNNVVSTGNVTVNGGSMSVTRIPVLAESNFSVNLNSGTFEIREDIAIGGAGVVAFNVSGGTLSSATKAIGTNAIINLSGGTILYQNGFNTAQALVNGSWNGGTIVSNTASVNNTTTPQLMSAWSSNANNVLTLFSESTAKTLLLNNHVNATQGVLSYNIYSSADNDNDVFATSGAYALNLGSDVQLQLNFRELDGDVNDYIGSSFKLFNAADYSGIMASLPSEVTIGGHVYGGIEWIDNLDIDGSITLSAVPEPSTYALIFGAFTLGAVVLRRRQRRA